MLGIAICACGSAASDMPSSVLRPDGPPPRLEKKDINDDCCLEVDSTAPSALDVICSVVESPSCRLTGERTIPGNPSSGDGDGAHPSVSTRLLCSRDSYLRHHDESSECATARQQKWQR